MLLGLVWLAWVYMTWVTNWLDPDRLPTRLMLLAVMFGSLVMSIGLPDAFVDHGDPARLLGTFGLDADGIARAIDARFPRRGTSRVKPAA